jgi:hypothetical protein
MPPAGHELQTELIDVTRVALAEFESLDESVLANCLRRVICEAENPEGASFGFQNVI